MNPTSNPARGVDTFTAECANLDPPYVFGRHPTANTPFPFTPREFARLLVLRGRVQDQVVGVDDRS